MSNTACPAKTKCPTCNGSGEVSTGGCDSETGYPYTIQCGYCGGEDVIYPEPELLEDETFVCECRKQFAAEGAVWNHIRGLRLCAECAATANFWDAMDNGQAYPPLPKEYSMEVPF